MSLLGSFAVRQLHFRPGYGVANMHVTPTFQAFINGVFQRIELFPVDPFVVVVIVEMLFEHVLQFISPHDAAPECPRV